MPIDWAPLLERTWWTYDPAEGGYSELYHSFNLLEGIAWFVFGLLVLARFIRHRRSVFELAYALAFFSFAASDFREAYRLDTWLIVAKAANLAALVWLRRLVLTRYYSGSKLF